MPDGDKIHSKLAWIYQKPYQIICEGRLSPEESTWELLRAFLREIKKSTTAVNLAKSIGDNIAQAVEEIDDGQVPGRWVLLSQRISDLAQGSSEPHYRKGIIERAAKGVLHGLRYGQRLETTEISLEVVRNFLYELYRANFRERIPLISSHYAGVDHLTLEERLSLFDEPVSSACSSWAKTLLSGGELQKLRRPRRHQVSAIDLNEDLL